MADKIAWHQFCATPGPACTRAWALGMLAVLVITAAIQWGPHVAGRLRLWWWIIQLGRGD